MAAAPVGDATMIGMLKSICITLLLPHPPALANDEIIAALLAAGATLLTISLKNSGVLKKGPAAPTTIGPPSACGNELLASGWAVVLAASGANESVLDAPITALQPGVRPSSIVVAQAVSRDRLCSANIGRERYTTAARQQRQSARVACA